MDKAVGSLLDVFYARIRFPKNMRPECNRPSTRKGRKRPTKCARLATEGANKNA